MGKELNRKKGQIGEDRATAYLQGLGFEIIERNYRFKRGEVDIIARKEGVYHFIEVKYRRNLKYGHPMEAITAEKIRRISAATNHYLVAIGLSGKVAISIDAVSILGDDIRLVEGLTAFM